MSKVGRQKQFIIRPRGAQRSGGGGPPEARAASAGWWRGRAAEKQASYDEASLSAEAPSTALLRRAVPLPRFAGADARERFCPPYEHKAGQS